MGEPLCKDFSRAVGRAGSTARVDQNRADLSPRDNTGYEGAWLVAHTRGRESPLMLP